MNHINNSFAPVSMITLSDTGIATLKQSHTKACLIGPATAGYMMRIIETGRMEKRIVDGCKALLALKLAYGATRLEQACSKGLANSKYNYTIIKNILLNHHEVVPATPTARDWDNAKGTHENLRGPSSFEI